MKESPVGGPLTPVTRGTIQLTGSSSCFLSLNFTFDNRPYQIVSFKHMPDPFPLPLSYCAHSSSFIASTQFPFLCLSSIPLCFWYYVIFIPCSFETVSSLCIIACKYASLP